MATAISSTARNAHAPLSCRGRDGSLGERAGVVAQEPAGLASAPTTDLNGESPSQQAAAAEQGGGEEARAQAGQPA